MLQSSDQRSFWLVVNNSCHLRKAGRQLVVSQSNLALSEVANSSFYHYSPRLKLSPMARYLLVVRHDFLVVLACEGMVTLSCFPVV